MEEIKYTNLGFVPSNGHLLTDELIQLRSDAMFKKKYRFLSRKSSDVKYGFFECLEHNVLFEQHLSSHFNGQVPKNCPQCFHGLLKANNRAKETTRKGINHPHALSDDFVANKCKELYKGKLKFIGRDPNNFKYGIFECPHGKLLRNMVTYNLKGRFPQGCDVCSKENRKYETILTPQLVRERSFEQFQGKIYYLERFEKDRECGIFICREHGITFTQKLYKHFKGQRACSLCKKDASRLARLVYDELNKHFEKEEIVKEKSFDDCKNLYHLKFDYYIEKLNLLIECDGEGHFYAVSQWGGEEGLKVRVSNDRIKDLYTKKNGINFLRISFFEINDITKIIAECLLKVKSGEYVYRIHDNQIPGD